MENRIPKDLENLIAENIKQFEGQPFTEKNKHRMYELCNHIVKEYKAKTGYTKNIAFDIYGSKYINVIPYEFDPNAL